jgi:ketosteroid isomerase-like protein
MKKIFMLLLVAFIVGSCQQVKELTNEEKQAITNEIKEISSAFWELNKNLTSENYEFMKTFYDEEFEKLWQTKPAFAVLNLSVIRGYDELMSKYEEIFENRASTDIAVTSHSISVLSKDVVLEVIEMDYSVTDRGGETYGPFETVFSNVWQKRDGKWKYLHLHQTYRKKKVEEN